MKPLLVAVFALALIPPRVAAQVYWQAQPAPIVTADHESWFRLGEPITYEGYYYYPAGARVFFNGNHMIRTGSYRGIPLYADTTIEPYSKVFVPVTGGQLQPYERRRTGALAGTTGSTAPSFPVTMAGEIGSEPEFTGTLGTATVPTAPEAVSESSPPAAAIASTRPPRDVIEAGLTPKGLNEIYVNYDGYRWKVSGPAVRLVGERFTQIGDYRGYPVYASRNEEARGRTIYIPSRAGLVARYERAGSMVVY